MDTILPYLWFIVIIMLITIGNQYWVYRDRETQVDSWQNLAAAKKLTFTPGKWLLISSISPSVQGKYKDCQLVLTTVQRKRGKNSGGKNSVTYTQISVRPKQHVKVEVKSDKCSLDQQLAYHELKTWLNGQSPFYAGGKLPIKVEAKGLNFVYEERGVITDNNFLERLFNFLVELTRTYPEIVALGGETVPALEQIASESSEELQPVAQQLLRDISADTQRLKWDSAQSFCPRCLTGCAPYEVSGGWWSSLTFYGCRTCRQSREFFPGPLIAVLNNRLEAELAEQPEGTRINWLQRRNLFDFSWVEIVQATDEEVERFAVQVGNDTDEWRKPRYKQMTCVVSAQCQLSENTLRILERMFGEVRVEAL